MREQARDPKKCTVSRKHEDRKPLLKFSQESLDLGLTGAGGVESYRWKLVSEILETSAGRLNVSTLFLPLRLFPLDVLVSAVLG